MATVGIKGLNNTFPMAVNLNYRGNVNWTMIYGV